MADILLLISIESVSMVLWIWILGAIGFVVLCYYIV